MSEDGSAATAAVIRSAWRWVKAKRKFGVHIASCGTCGAVTGCETAEYFLAEQHKALGALEAAVEGLEAYLSGAAKEAIGDEP